MKRRSMATMTSSSSATAPSPLLLILCLIALSSLLPPTLAAPPGSGDGFSIAGRVKLEGMGSKGFGLPAKTANTKVILNGGQRVTFVRPDGYFALLTAHILDPSHFQAGYNPHKSHNVPAGTHLIEVVSLGYFFSPVRVDISARNPGKVQAALTENGRHLNELVLEPLKEEQYYEMREPFSIMSLLKSPMGMMVGFMLVVVFLMPKLMENIDPEELRRTQEEMRVQGVPSLSSLVARNT